ncbi:MAG: hypothetical protein K2O45_15490, partial [Oscillospiraceae bacterium]|nr:hypothetical protein [Oscillospiraceae bacterium]
MSDTTKRAASITEIYATLVGRVDNAISVLEQITEQQSFDWYHIIQVTEMLKAALLEAEEAYIQADEEREGRLIILPHTNPAPPEYRDLIHS